MEGLSMEDVFEFLNQDWINSLIGVIGVGIGLTGLGVALYFFFASKRDPKPVYQYWSRRILGKDEDNLPKDVSVKFKGIEVIRLNRTTIIFWNDGTKVLNGSDIVKADPLIISYPEGSKILSCQILRQTKEANGFSLKLMPDKPNVLLIDFEYLDPKGGVTCEIVHDTQEHDPEVLGSIKGIPSGFKALGEVRSHIAWSLLPFLLHRSPKMPVRKNALWILMLFGFFVLISQIIWKDLIRLDNFFFILGIVYILVPVLPLWLIRRRYPKHLEVDVNDDLL